MQYLQFIDKHGSFTMKNPENISGLYFPLASKAGLRSAVTPSLGGDAKLDQESFLLEPVSVDNLHNNRSSRNFWFADEKGKIFSAVGTSAAQEAAKFTQKQEESELTAGFMWHSLKRFLPEQLISTAISFIPYDSNVEILHVSLTNRSNDVKQITAFAAIPIYGRSADNLRDHRHVTSLLHRIQTTESGVLVCPTMSFDERGHRENKRIYYVIGCTGSGQLPDCFYPTVESFLGEGGTFTHPRAVYENHTGVSAFYHTAGKEAMGAFRFKKHTLAPGETADYIVLLGITEQASDALSALRKYGNAASASAALQETKHFWQKQVNVSFHTADSGFDSCMKWISFQPFLRRLFGCSFLPHHDYGRGGRGWRDLWQDCLSLLLMEPQNVGETIVKNFGGVRIDGTNATIIGDGDGHFIADRNGISRVWMDHALWPFMTTKLYVDQTGDVEILNRQAPYFKDAQVMRGTAIDKEWDNNYGSLQLTEKGEVYTGTILEHLLIQQLTAFYEVGNHNIYRLRGADWNDALDMAAENGESVAFTCAYAGNLKELASLVHLFESKYPNQDILLPQEMEILLQKDRAVFDHITEKQEILASYASCCRHTICGRFIKLSPSELYTDLILKADWLTDHLRSQEWINVSDYEGWYNSYYDNHGRAVEGIRDDHVRMMLAGQVFSVMGGIATDEQIRKIIKSADHYLYQKEIGGYVLNTNFHELKFDMGRMFGFAYGEKENGAVFSHMTVMYANALYRRGYAREGWKALKTLVDTALSFDTSRIYPGIPEYFRSDGRGMYHYLTGAASWYVLTMITEVFGAHGEAGDLVFSPKLLAEQFDDKGDASISMTFAKKRFQVTYRNPYRKDFGSYQIASASCDGTALDVSDGSGVVLSRTKLQSLSEGTHQVDITLI